MNKIIKRQEILPTYRSNQPKDLLNNNISVAFTKCIKSQDRNWVPRKSAAVIMYDDCKIYILFVAAAKFTQYVGKKPLAICNNYINISFAGRDGRDSVVPGKKYISKLINNS